ncbi:hypothetical protein PR048_011557 [Dryococelus australis]|uniref:Uncharacterized protein n=1 Tax=Dryococelus australis TaxID=614101 RepID=A0ABQ9HLW9_9NEOP|nr:hypothetical protein PR048_011557 [Dryococelus australis]
MQSCNTGHPVIKGDTNSIHYAENTLVQQYHPQKPVTKVLKVVADTVLSENPSALALLIHNLLDVFMSDCPVCIRDLGTTPVAFVNIKLRQNATLDLLWLTEPNTSLNQQLGKFI